MTVLRTTTQPNEHPTASTLTVFQPVPGVMSVGLVVCEWNDELRQYMQLLGSVFGRAGIKLQLLCQSDFARQDDKLKHLHGIVYQVGQVNQDEVSAQRFYKQMLNFDQQLLPECILASAFTIGNNSFENLEAAISLKAKSHERGLVWLGNNNAKPDTAAFYHWCQGIAETLRNADEPKSILAQ